MVKKYTLSDFDFELPESFIAQNPCSPRDAAKLMVLNRKDKTITHKHFYDLPRLLDENDVLVVNNSKVIPARISFEFEKKEVEVFLLRRFDDKGFECLVKPGKVFKEGFRAKINDNLRVYVRNVLADGSRIIDFTLKGGEPALNADIFAVGQTPLPPYIKHSTSNMEDYQTVYARRFGSVAAPTAGLHFTEKLLSNLSKKGVDLVEVLLHVNRGTFMPVKTENYKEHKMHSEFFDFGFPEAQILSSAVTNKKRIVAVGTTSVRVLESNFKDGAFKSGTGETDIFIYPGYKWKCVDALITNFHLPKSTLLMLVSSFAGKDFIFEAYEEAKKHGYKFFSFGDGMLII